MTDKKKTILIVDDDIDILEQTRAYLEAAGYTVISEEGEVAAKKRLEEAIDTIDMAILDLMMENQDSGFIVSHKIKRMKPQMPVIIVTAVTSQTGIHFSADSHHGQSWIKADALIEKPIRYEQLMMEIERLFKE